MGNLSHKIDFAVIVSVKNANPNGDPLNGNRPRVNYDGFGELSDVCIKRKIRNRLMDNGEALTYLYKTNSFLDYFSNCNFHKFKDTDSGVMIYQKKKSK